MNLTKTAAWLAGPLLALSAGAAIADAPPTAPSVRCRCVAPKVQYYVYGESYTEAYEGRWPLRFFGVAFNVFLLGMSLVVAPTAWLMMYRL